MTIKDNKIENKIVSVAIKQITDIAPDQLNIDNEYFKQILHEKVERPNELNGTTYKLKSPLTEHSLYVTINDIVLNNGTEHESHHPFEIFVNSRDMTGFQWITALTRVISGVFRKGGDVLFIVRELASIHDPKGGYLAKGGKWVPSLVAEIGAIIERHYIKLGLIIKEDRSELIAAAKEKVGIIDKPLGSYCKECGIMAVVMKDGCATCLNCGASKCG
jgi:hypothetical protein